MKLIVVGTLFSLCFATLHSLVMGTKEEPEEGVLSFHPFPAHFFGGPIEQLLRLLSPSDLHLLCSNVEGLYDRLLKRGPTFNAWGGKKRTIPVEALVHQLYGKRNPTPASNFNPWGGKRGELDDYLLNRSSKRLVYPQKPDAFHSWGGR